MCYCTDATIIRKAPTTVAQGKVSRIRMFTEHILDIWWMSTSRDLDDEECEELGLSIQFGKGQHDYLEQKMGKIDSRRCNRPGE